MSSEQDSGIRVVVTPSQPSYFAGEQFSVTITFTNTRSPESQPARSQAQRHKRGAHSISSAPLARPPTSPGTPRTVAPTFKLPPNDTGNAPARKGLVGKGPGIKSGGGVPALLEQSRKRLLARSLSVDIGPSELPISPHVPSPSRSPLQPIPSNHPHARKQSVLDGQLQLHELQQAPSPYPSSASNSAFSLSLDPIAEGNHSFPPTPNIHSYPPHPPQPQTRRQPHVGLGHGPPPSHLQQPRTAATSTFPQSNTELVLYSYAQLKGAVHLTPAPGVTNSPDQVRTMNAVRASLSKRSVIGGGSMDITSSLHSHLLPSRRRSHGRSSSFSAGIFSILSPSSSASSVASIPQSQSWSPTHKPRTQSWFLSPSPFTGAGPLGLGSEEDFPSEAPLPTFEVPSTMITVDLSLGPGESRSYTYTVPLPDLLPPTFRGRSMRFSYELVVGTCRGLSGTTGANSASRVMKVPIRVYNHVTVGPQPKPYDLMWPVAKRRKPNFVEVSATVAENLKKGANKLVSSSRLTPSAADEGFNGLQDYAQRLLASFPDTGVHLKLPTEVTSSIGSDPERERERQDEGALTGCREAVELLTRTPKKASFDVNKDGVKVAVLTFTKSAYRLGETVLGAVELNERKSRARVLKLSAVLETHEVIPSSLSSSNSRHMRRMHAEHHSSFVLSSLRTTFALDIPSDATPAFKVRLGDDIHHPPEGGLEWKVRLCLLVAIASETSTTSTEGVRVKHLVRDGPRGKWGTSWKAPSHLAPLEHPDPRTPPSTPSVSTARSWASFFAASFLGAAEGGFHDGDEATSDDELDDGPDLGGGEEGWREVKVETVECEVPIKVWPGNTAFKAMDVVFDV